MKTLIILVLSCTVAAADMPLVTFDGNPDTTFNFAEHSPPSGGWPNPACATTGTWNVTNGHGVMDGDIRVEWGVQCSSGGWPGFIRATAAGHFIDASTALGGSLILMVRSTSPEYTGFQVSFGTTEKWKTAEEACSGDLGPNAHRGCYIASFTVPSGDDFVPVRIPFSSFSDMWFYGNGEQYKTCAEDKTVCPTAKTLASIQQIDLWAQGVKGKAHLEVKSIATSNEESNSSRIDYLRSAVV